MSHADVYAVVSPLVPIRHMAWPQGAVPPLPWAVYLGKDAPIGADNGQVAVRHRWTVELYEARRDAELEKAVGDALRDAFGPVTRNESWIEDEEMLEISYTFYQIEGESDG